jgi:2-(1,2-epoxy-1,2-dihydrophenyl)acetyl-CoA isomerase
MTEILTETKTSVRWIWLNRPQASNAYSPEMIESFVGELKSADNDRSIRAIVIAAKGEAFCAGGDIKAMKDRKGMFSGEAHELRDKYMEGIQQIPHTFARLRKPVIASIQGPAIGAGCDLVAMCDLRVALEGRAKFAETFCKVGLVPGDGGAWFLIRAVGFSKATEMFFLANTYSAQQAFQMGLVQLVITGDLDTLYQQTQELALKLTQLPPIALQLTKKALAQAYDSYLEQHLDVVAAYQGITQRSHDHIRALQNLQNPDKGEFLQE